MHTKRKTTNAIRGDKTDTIKINQIYGTKNKTDEVVAF